MNPALQKFYDSIQKQKYQNDLLITQDRLAPVQATPSLEEIAQEQLIQLGPIDEETQKRLWSELFGFGPIENFLGEDDVTEILCNQFDQIYVERNGSLEKSNDHFQSAESYQDFIERLCQKCQTYINREKPFVECQIENLRVTIIYQDLARGYPLLAIRKKNQRIYSLDHLVERGWCNENQINCLKSLIELKKNFLVVGGTGSGKTTVLQSLMTLISPNERVVIIEDTQELMPTNACSTSLLTQTNILDPRLNVSMDDLLKRTLRLRPDRIAVGEIRGPEAKTLLMALSTGHDGSIGSMHARTAQEALLRLEMLVQMGAPQWSLTSIRRLIGITLNSILVVERRGKIRYLKGIYELQSIEEMGITLHQVV